MSYQVWCWDRPLCADGSQPDNGAGNALRFATEAEAEAYGQDLFLRWTALDHYEVRVSEEPVSYRFWDGRARRISSD